MAGTTGDLALRHGPDRRSARRGARSAGGVKNATVTTLRRTAATLAVIVIALTAGCTSNGAGGGNTTTQSVDAGSRTTTASPATRPTPAAPSPIPLVVPGQPGLVVGHRGNAAGAPEDTLVSEVSAQKVGARVLEFDLHMTSDGVPIVMHDETVDRTTDGSGTIDDMTLAQIQQLDAGSWFSPAFAGTPVPTFEQILQFASTTDAIILPELKEAVWSTDQVRTVADLIRRYHMVDRTMFQSFYQSVLQTAQQVAPDIARAALVNDAPPDPVGYIASFGGQGLLPKNTAVTKDLVTTLHDAGLSIMVWTVDEPEEWARLTGLGVDGIMSNNPAALWGWLQRYRQDQ
jgi:glycerophosphoryl diester phosphodiesterase